MAPVHLPAPRPCGLALRALAPWHAGVLLQLVGAVEIGSVGRRVEPRPDAEAVDGCAGRDQRRHRILIQVAARDYRHLRQAAPIDHPAPPPGELAEVAAVESYAAEPDAFRRQLAC